MFRDFDLDFDKTKKVFKYKSIEEAYEDFKKVFTFNDDLFFYNGLVQNLKINKFILAQKGEDVKAEDLLIGINLGSITLPFIIVTDYFNPSMLAISCPFVEFSEVHDIYNNYMVKAGLNLQPISESAYFPLLKKPSKEECPDFRSWLSTCKQKYYSHFFGEKSHKISWTLNHWGSDVSYKIMADTHSCHIQHNESYMDRYAKGSEFIHNLINVSPWCGYNPDFCWLIAGKDIEIDKYVGAMYVYIVGKRAYLHNIACSKDEKYKPYGLVLAAHYAAIRTLFFDPKFDIDIIDLGCNMDDCMNYKDSMRPIKHPWLNIDIFSNFNELKGLLNG